MLEWVRTHRRSAAICGLTLLVPALVYLNLLGKAWSLRAEYQDEIQRLQPRIARLSGIKAHEEELTAAASSARQMIDRLVHPVTTDRAEVSAALQNDVWQLLTDAGLSVSNSQVMPLREGEQFDYIGLKLTASGEIAALDDALADLADFTPIVILESLDIWPNRDRGSRDGSPPVQHVTASMKLVSLRAVF